MKILGIIILVLGVVCLVLSFFPEFTLVKDSIADGSYIEQEDTLNSYTPILASFLLPAGAFMLYTGIKKKSAR